MNITTSHSEIIPGNTMPECKSGNRRIILDRIQTPVGHRTKMPFFELFNILSYYIVIYILFMIIFEGIVVLC